MTGFFVFINNMKTLCGDNVTVKNTLKVSTRVDLTDIYNYYEAI